MISKRPPLQLHAHSGGLKFLREWVSENLYTSIFLLKRAIMRLERMACNKISLGALVHDAVRAIHRTDQQRR